MSILNKIPVELLQSGAVADEKVYPNDRETTFASGRGEQLDIDPTTKITDATAASAKHRCCLSVSSWDQTSHFKT